MGYSSGSLTTVPQSILLFHSHFHFNEHSHFWWPDGDSNAEGREIEDLFTSLNLSQIISEPTNFTPNKRPTCIDLIATDQPNLV